MLQKWRAPEHARALARKKCTHTLTRAGRLALGLRRLLKAPISPFPRALLWSEILRREQPLPAGSGQVGGLGLGWPGLITTLPIHVPEERRDVEGRDEKQGMKRQGERREFNWCRSIVGLVCFRIHINKVTEWNRSRVWCLNIQHVGFSAIYWQKRNMLLRIMFALVYNSLTQIFLAVWNHTARCN